MLNKYLLNHLSHSSVTNLKKLKINNHDAALLVIASEEDGTSKTCDVIKALQSWRPGLAYTYLWNTSKYGGYGFVGQDVNSVSNEVYHQPNFLRGDMKETVSYRRTYWYRVKTGHYRLTFEGFRRLAELQEQLAGHFSALARLG